MKTHLQNCNQSYSFLKIGKRTSTMISVMLSVAVLNLAISCSYYTVKNVPIDKETISKQIKTFNETEKYVIIHSNDLSWHLRNMVIDEDKQTISGDVVAVVEMHQYKKPREIKRVHKYASGKQEPLSELHFYLKSSTAFQANTNANIPLSDINSISVNDKNTGRAIANVLLTTVGVIFVAAIIVAATKSSCPFVYIKNGEQYNFVGELYPGRITAKMQNDDYLPLPKSIINNNEFILKITNQLKEVQHTDLLQLLQVNHDKEVQVLLDCKGVVQTFAKLENPKNVTLDDGVKSIEASLGKDNNFYAFNTSKVTKNSTRNVLFEFDKPEDSKKAKLYLTAKNSVWLDYIFGKFNEQFGSYYNTFQKNQQKVEGDEIRKWSNGQHIPLSVFVKEKNGWQLIERINTVGPMAMRDIVVPINLEEINGNKLQVKLETGFMFWEVDYVGIDYTENVNVETVQISPFAAIDHNGNNVTDLLLSADQQYFVQPKVGDEVEVRFSIKESKLNQTFFLKNRGYYNYIRTYSGIPDFEKLKSFRDDHTFTIFSERAYFDFANFDINKLASHE